MSIITKIFGGSAEKVIGAVGGVLDNLITNKEELAAAKLEIAKEINRNMEAMQADATKRLEIEASDRSSSRQRETDFVKATGHMDWMMTFTGVVVLLSFVGVTIFVLNYELPKTGEHIIINLIGILEGAVIGVITYYYGSSAGSRIKDMKN